MARNLMKKNWKVMVYDLNKDAVQAAVQDGKQTQLIHMDAVKMISFFTVKTNSPISMESLFYWFIFYACQRLG